MASSTEICHPFPLFASGTVIPGFGSGGGKIFRLPDASIECPAVTEVLDHSTCYGFARVEGVEEGKVYKMLMAVRYKPGGGETVNVHIMHKFPSNFTGKTLKIIQCLNPTVSTVITICILGKLDRNRHTLPHRTFEQTLRLIKTDLDFVKAHLDLPGFIEFRNHSFFNNPVDNPVDSPDSDDA